MNENESDGDEIDFKNFKGIYFNDDPNKKYQDPDTGCHFEYNDLCKRLLELKELRLIIDKELGIITSSSPVKAVKENKKSHILKVKRS
jgi:hypothetical protein